VPQQSVHPDAAAFIGTWKLLSFESRISDGRLIYPFGRDIHGLLIYTKGGYMSGKMIRKGRLKFASGDPMKGTLNEIKEAFEGFIGYYGRYEVDCENRTVNHHVEGSMFPNWEEEVQKRFFDFSGNRLTLRTPPMKYGADGIVSVLVWERLE
jgi:hypothetical protein